MKRLMQSKMPIASVAKVISGYAFKSSEFSDRGIPVIKIKNIRTGNIDFSDTEYVSDQYLSLDSKYHVRSEDILISLTGSHVNQPNSVVGRVARYPRGKGIALLNQRAGKVIIKDPDCCDKSFLYYHLFNEQTRRDIAALAHGAANQANVSPSQIESIRINLPPHATQKKIGIILSTYDALIENNTQRIKILQEMAQTIYKEWFVNFRFPGHEKVKMVNSPLGKIPDGWEVSDLGSLADVTWGDTSVTKGFYVDEGYDAFSASGLDGKLEYFDYDRDGVILSAIGANCGETWFAKGKWSCIKNTIRFWAILPTVSTEYLFFATKGKDFWPKRGSAQPFISQGDARACLILVPPATLTKSFCSVAYCALAEIDILRKKNQNLRQTRDLLLPKLISGELDVSELDIRIEGNES